MEPASETSEPVEVDEHEGWAEVRLNRPHRRNALSQEVAGALVEALARVAGSGRAVAVLGANGPVFCAGGDIDEMRAGRPAPFAPVVEAMSDMPLLVIARVEGPVVGAGLALPAACAVVVCSPAARFVLPAAEQRDMFPAAFFRYLGAGLPARRLVDIGLTSRPVEPAEAVALGWATAAVAASEVDAEVRRWVDRAVARPGAAAGAAAFWQEHGRSRRPAD